MICTLSPALGSVLNVTLVDLGLTHSPATLFRPCTTAGLTLLLIPGKNIVENCSGGIYPSDPPVREALGILLAVTDPALVLGHSKVVLSRTSEYLQYKIV